MGQFRMLLACATALVFGAAAEGVAAQSLSPEEELGKSIFFDTDLSSNGNQSCAVCHTPEAGWTGPISDINAAGAVYEGSILGRFGNRKPPSAAYATPSPILHFVIEKKEALFIGGNFWDGRATGERLGNPAADQALGPFLNPVEQALPDNACVVYLVCTTAAYPVSFEDVWGREACAISWPPDVEAVCAAEGGFVDLSPEDRETVEASYEKVGLSVAAYEDSPEVNQYSSKFDYFLAGLVSLTKEEKKGFNLFKSKGKCANCHVLDPGPNGEPPLFTDFTFDNLGVPRNPDNPWYDQTMFNPEGDRWIDLGLGGFLQSRMDYQRFAHENLGKQKVPTLRNLTKRPYPEFVKAYTHNGYFKTLEQVVHFYNTRDAKPPCVDPFTPVEEAIEQGCWPAPEVPVNVNTDELGDLKLTDAQEDAIVTFLGTLDDGFELPNPAQ